MEDKITANGRYNFKKNKILYLMMLPFMLLFFMFTILPIIISIFFSLTNYNILQFPKFVGFDNYIRLLLEDKVFITAIKNTFVIAVVTGPAGYILAFLMAWLINELKPKVRAVFTIIFYAPSISGNVFLIFAMLFSNDPYGFINAKLMSWGITEGAILWLKDANYMMPVVIIVSLWLSLGFGFLSFIAGLQTIDRAQYEAGQVDGISNRWQELWFITLPNMKPQLMFGAVMSITNALGVGDITAQLMGFPSANYAVHTMVNHLNDYGSIRMEMGYASAIAVLLFALMLGSNGLVQKFLKRVGT